MAKKVIDATGLRCPQPILKLTIAMPEMSPGDTVELRADCDTFEADIRSWCSRLNKTLLSLTKDGDVDVATIQF